MLAAKGAPWSVCSILASSTGLISFCASMAPKITSRNASIRRDRVSPPCGLASTKPVVITACIPRMALAGEAPKRSAAARRGKPTATAVTSLVRRSVESGLPMHARPRPARMMDHVATAAGESPFDSVWTASALYALPFPLVARLPQQVDAAHQVARIAVWPRTLLVKRHRSGTPAVTSSTLLSSLENMACRWGPDRRR